MEQRYDVITTGVLAPGHDTGSVKANLIHVFKISESLAERLLGGEQYVVRKGLDLRTAGNMLAALEKAGLPARLDPPEPAAALAPSAPIRPRPDPRTSPCNVFFSGAIASGFTVMGVKTALARQCRMSATMIERLFAGGPVLVFGNIDRSSAERMRAMLEAAGALCEIVPLGQAPAHTALPVQSMAQPGRTLYDPARPVQTPAQIEAERLTTGMEVTLRFFPLSFLLIFCRPIVEIDGGAREATWWRKLYFPLAPGFHTVRIYFSYLGKHDCGLNERHITVDSGAPCKIEYFMWPWIFAPGSMSVSGGVGPDGAGSTQPEPVYADLGRRIGAACIDLMVLGGFSTLFALMLAGMGVHSSQEEGMAAAAMQVLLWLYFALLEASPLQGTLGKKLLKLRVTDEDGRRISLGRATMRHLARLFLLVLTLGLGFFMIAFTNRRQAIHDVATNTLVESA